MEFKQVFGVLICIGIFFSSVCGKAQNAENNSPIFSITEFGVISDQKKVQTTEIQNAIDKIHESGGGLIQFTPGTYISGTIVLKQGVSINLMSGALLQGSSNIKDYMSVGEKGKIVFIYGKNLSHWSISGQGKIDGNGREFWKKNYEPKERPEPWIFFEGCQDLNFTDINFENSPSHTLRIETSDQVRISGISIINPFEGPNTDGIDIVDSRNVFISNAYISTGDDAICLKSQKAIVENVVVTNCILESDDSAIKLGTGSKVNIRFCVFSNNIIRNSRYGIAIFMLDGGIFENNRFSDMIIETNSRHAYEYPIYIDLDKRTPQSSYGIIRSNVFNNLTLISGGKVLASGNNKAHITSLDFHNINFILKDESDFTKANKPRGNKNYPSLPESVDLSRKKAHMIIGYTDRLGLSEISFDIGSSSLREPIYLERVKEEN